MNKTYSLDGVQAILSYPFKQPGWQAKFAILAGLSFLNYAIPILPSILVMGYVDKIMQAIILDNAEPTLPEWSDWSNLFSRGVKIFGATIVYMLPAIAFLGIGYLILILAPFMSIFFMSTMDGQQVSSAIFFIQMLGTFAAMLLFGIGFILISLVGFILPVVIAHVVAKDSFAAAFRIKEWWQIARANLWGFVTAIAMTTGAYLVGFMVIRVLYLTVVLCLLTPFLTLFLVVYLALVSSVMFAEAYRKGAENVAEGIIA